MSNGSPDEMSSGLPLHADLMLEAAPEAPFDWVREGTSLWLFEESGAFGIPRIGVEAEPWTWDQRRYAANFAFAGGRVLQEAGVGPAPGVKDAAGRPAVIGGGPMTFRCIEPFRRWAVSFQGEMVDTHVSNQIENTVDRERRIPLRYEIELTMAAPANVQDISPENFAKWGKGKQRDAVSVGLGWRFEQVLRGEGELEVDGRTRSFKAVGSRVKRRSVRTDGLMLRGHAWQTVVFPDGSAVGYEARPVHDEGFEPWNEGFIWKDGRMHHARVIDPPWLNESKPRGEDISFTLESDLGRTRIQGTSELSTFRVATKDLWGLNLHQGAGRYVWGDQVAFGMIERSMPPGKVVPR